MNRNRANFNATFWWSCTAVLFSWSWQLLIGGLAIGGFEIRPGMLAYLYVLACPLPKFLAPRIPQQVWGFCAALVFAELPAMTFRGSEAVPVLGILVAGLLLALPLIVWALFVCDSDAPSQAQLRTSECVRIGAIALAVIAVFQIWNRVMLARGVPNEERSLLVLGAEVHHITWGLILVVAVGLAWSWAYRGAITRRVAVVAHGVGCGFVLDEWLYYMRREMTDAAYFEMATVVSALAATIGVTALWIMYIRVVRRPE